MTKHSNTKANSLQNNNAMTQDLLKNQIHKICRYDEMCKMLIINLVEERKHRFKSISTSAYPQEEKDIRLKAEVEHTGKLISQTANYITRRWRKSWKALNKRSAKEMFKGAQWQDTL